MLFVDLISHTVEEDARKRGAEPITYLDIFINLGTNQEGNILLIPGPAAATLVESTVINVVVK